MVAIEIRHEIFLEGVVPGVQHQLFARYLFSNNSNAILYSKIQDQNRRKKPVSTTKHITLQAHLLIDTLASTVSVLLSICDTTKPDSMAGLAVSDVSKLVVGLDCLSFLKHTYSKWPILGQKLQCLPSAGHL